MANTLFDWVALSALAVDTPASAVQLSGMSKQLILAAAQDLEFRFNWSGAGDELTAAETDAIEAAVALMLHEVMTDVWSMGDCAMRVLARYTEGNTQTIEPGNTEIVEYPNRDYDSHNAVTTGAAWTFTAPVAGFYNVIAALLFKSLTGALDGRSPDLFIYVNGAQLMMLARSPSLAAVGDFAHIRGSDTLYLHAGDTLNIRAHNGAAQNIQTGPNTQLARQSVAITQVG